MSSGTPRPGLAIGDVPPFVLERRASACARPGVDARWFEPSFGEDPNAWHTVGKARAVCQGCRVREECLAWALPHKRLDGMWGGKTPAERTELRRTA